MRLENQQQLDEWREPWSGQDWASVRGGRLVRLVIFTAVLVAMFSHVFQAQALTVTTAAVTFPAVTLDGTSQTVAGSTSAWRVDATGETGGWNLTVASTDFTAASRTIAVANFSIRLLNSDIMVVSGDPTGPSSTQTTFTSLSATPLKIASAGVGDGNGVYDLTPGFELAVPAETYTGAYSATLTVDVAVGP
jgi:hypothetical protein